jgi:K+-sensing histidine kinase KdpD
MSTTTSPEAILHSLVHDLRQPLSNLETSIFYLDIVLSHPSGRVGEQMRSMERQLAQANQLLHQVAQELRALRTQREGAGVAENFPLTKSATARFT